MTGPLAFIRTNRVSRALVELVQVLQLPLVIDLVSRRLGHLKLGLGHRPERRLNRTAPVRHSCRTDGLHLREVIFRCFVVHFCPARLLLEVFRVHVIGVVSRTATVSSVVVIVVAKLVVLGIQVQADRGFLELALELSLLCIDHSLLIDFESFGFAS